MNGPSSLPPPDLRPLSIGEILDLAISIYRKDFVTLVGIVALVSAPLMMIQVAAGLVTLPSDPNRLIPSFSSSPPSLNQLVPLLAFYGVSLATGIVGAVATIFQLGAVAAAVSHRYHKQETGIKKAYGQALQHWASMLAAAILVALTNLIVGGLFIALTFGLPLAGSFGLSRAGSSSGASALGLLVFPLLCLGSIPTLILAIYLNIKWMFAQQVIVLENLGPLKGLGRSWRVVKGSFWRVLLVSLVLAVFMYIIQTIPATVIGTAAALAVPGSFVLTTVVNNIARTLIVTLASPIQFAVLTLLYYDLRVRREGYDLELKAKSMQPLNPASAGLAE